jgi:tRNA(Ile)-lysidine synthase
VRVEAEALTSLHPALAARVARIVLSSRASGRFIGFEHVTAFLDFARNGAPGSALSLPGQQVVRRGDRLELRPEGPRDLSRRSAKGAKVVEGGGNTFPVPLSIPGEVTLADQGWTISATPFDALPSEPACRDRAPRGRVEGEMAREGGVEGARARGNTVAVAASALSLPLAVRTRRPGDRFRPLGLGGAGKKLQDFLVDRKVAREERDALPLVVDNADRIVWVVGQSVGEDFRVTAPSRGVILLKARRLGGEG